MPDDKLKKQLLREEMELLGKAVETLNLSIKKCTNIIGKEHYSFEELESFDSLTSKFGRTSDLFTQKVLRTVFILLHEPFIPFIDFLNQAEKMGIIKSADQMLEIRDLRNQITHEYLPEAITELVPEVLEYSNLLISNINKAHQFITNRNWIADSDS